VERADFPWQPLGTLLVEHGLLTAAELDRALAEQRRTGRLLGQVLVTRGYVSASSLVRALAAQHGVALRRTPERANSHDRLRTRGWRPLGRMLVELEYIDADDLARVLTEQKEHPERLLGEILVADGYISEAELAFALAEQHGVDLDAEEGLERPQLALRPLTASGQPTYHVHEVAYEPAYRRGDALYLSGSFLEAAEFACEYVQEQQPGALEIEKVDGTRRETVWTYSKARAEAKVASRERLVRTFGFDPVRWGSR
jgi:hypothetical protein